MEGTNAIKHDTEFKVSFGYKCNGNQFDTYEVSNGCDMLRGIKMQRPSSLSFSCLSGAAVSANATLANTNICHGVIGEEILPTWDSPNSFRRIASSPSLLKLDMLSSSLQSSTSNLSCSPSCQSDSFESDSFLKAMSAPSKGDTFLNATEVQVAGGAAGEDRVQAVCSEENGWLYCGIYDGFNGRDAADFLAGTLYDTFTNYFNASLDWESKQECLKAFDSSDAYGSLQYILEDNSYTSHGKNLLSKNCNFENPNPENVMKNAQNFHMNMPSESFQRGVVDCLLHALNQAENDFLYMVEQEMEDRPDLVSVGSCVLVVLLHGNNLYTLSLGDSRAVLATYEQHDNNGSKELKAIQLTESHTVDNEVERTRLLGDHPDDSMTISMGKVKGKLKVTRALGVGYLKKILNDALMGILSVRDLISPPYVSTIPSVNVHRISKDDHFVIVASDGLFDFFSNDEVVQIVNSYIQCNPSADPAKYIVNQLILRAANSAGFSMEELMKIPPGRRRKYHDDVTVIVIILGTNQRTSKASTCV
ncbi:hypothetical protein EUGRSUZ_B01309 [Eucalyptus grandis]|uniref:Uncharacterized protein n=2 Tax=Eucalyptus grandis TaxID=71139 RepID=A0ACC3LRL1_EUCGR|nr:hypothetical protein EUGRSUZ_B01309 [Eucalyptus grandis]